MKQNSLIGAFTLAACGAWLWAEIPMITTAFALQTPAPAQPAAAPPAAAAPADKPKLKKEELEQLLAPIALYPDSLLTQVLMASTYPLEIVEADRWTKANASLKGDPLAVELEKKEWDPSVKSLVNFPTVLSTMSEKLDTTIKLGDAFIDQQADVMNTVQVLRNKAQTNGNLKANDDIKVIVEPAPAPTQTTVVVQQAPPQIIKIEPAQPTVVYVPTYEPAVVYGAWPYPAYPPYPYYPPRPPGYVASTAVAFGVGVACGAAWGYAWGHSNWGHGDVDIDVNRNVNFNGNINRNNYQTNINNVNKNNVNKNSWNHDSSHRGGVAYSNKAAAQKYGGASDARAAQAREQFRGRDASQGGLGGASQNRAGAGAGGLQGGASAGQNRAGAGAGGLQDKGGVGAGQNRAATPAAQNRDTSGTRSGALNDGNRSGSEARAASERGQASRSSGPGGGAARSGGGSGGGRSGGGGGGRSGGGGGRR